MLRLVPLVALLCSPAVAAPPKTSTGFYYPTDSSGPWYYYGWLAKVGSKYHLGQDMERPQWADVYAISAGTITFKFDNNADNHGNDALVIRHCADGPGDFEALYAHIVTTLVAGNSVAAGQKIGTIGWHAGGPHLHFGINPAQTVPRTSYGYTDSLSDLKGFVDPIDWVRRWGPGGCPYAPGQGAPKSYRDKMYNEYHWGKACDGKASDILGCCMTKAFKVGPSGAGTGRHGWAQLCEGGVLYCTEVTACFTYPPYHDVYFAHNTERGTLGFPVGDVWPSQLGGCVQHFEGGRIYRWPKGKRTIAIHGGYWRVYEELGDLKKASPLRRPIADHTVDCRGLPYMAFERGCITSPAEGIRVDWSPYYIKQDGKTTIYYAFFERKGARVRYPVGNLDHYHELIDHFGVEDYWHVLSETDMAAYRPALNRLHHLVKEPDKATVYYVDKEKKRHGIQSMNSLDCWGFDWCQVLEVSGCATKYAASYALPECPPKLEVADSDYPKSIPAGGTATIKWRAAYSREVENPRVWWFRGHEDPLTAAPHSVVGTPTGSNAWTADLELPDSKPGEVYRFCARGDGVDLKFLEPSIRDYEPALEIHIDGGPPTLAWVGSGGHTTDGVSPNRGDAGKTLFRFRVKYSDPDGDPARFVRLKLKRDGSFHGGYTLKGRSGDARAGRIYAINLALPAGQYEYRFLAAAQDGWAPRSLSRPPRCRASPASRVLPRTSALRSHSVSRWRARWMLGC